MDIRKQEFISHLKDGLSLPPRDVWKKDSNLHKVWRQRVSEDDIRWKLCGGDPGVFADAVYNFLDKHLDEFLAAVYDQGFAPKDFRDIDKVSLVDQDTVRNTPNNPGYFRNVCFEEMVLCGGDADIKLSMKAAVSNSLKGHVRKTFFMPALFADIFNGSISSNMVLTFNKSCKLVSVFSPNVYRYLLKRLHRHAPGKTVLFPTASWGVPVVAADTLGYTDVGIVDVQDPVLDKCYNIKADIDRLKDPLFDTEYNLHTWATPSEVMDTVVPSGWDHIISCPPYYDLEMYSASSQQSTDLYGTYEEWLEGYWRPTVSASRRLLNQDGVFAFIMGHHIRYRYMSSDMVKIAVEEGFRQVDEIRIVPKKKPGKLYVSPVEKYEICSIFKL